MAVYITESLLDKFKSDDSKNRTIEDIKLAKEHWDTGECKTYDGDSLYIFFDLDISESNIITHFTKNKRNLKKLTIKNELYGGAKTNIKVANVKETDHIVELYLGKYDGCKLVYDLNVKKILMIEHNEDSDVYEITTFTSSLYNNEFIQTKYVTDSFKQQTKDIVNELGIEFKV